MKYDSNIYRPPSEAYTLLLQVTSGCSHNKCTYCNMYKDVQFKTETAFSSIHISNIAPLNGTLPRDKQKFIDRLNAAIKQF